MPAVCPCAGIKTLAQVSVARKNIPETRVEQCLKPGEPEVCGAEMVGWGIKRVQHRHQRGTQKPACEPAPTAFSSFTDSSKECSIAHTFDGTKDNRVCKNTLKKRNLEEEGSDGKEAVGLS